MVYNSVQSLLLISVFCIVRFCLCILLLCNLLAHCGNDVYKLVTQKKNWADAMQHCKSIGMHLVVVADEYEQEDLADYLRSVDGQYCLCTVLSACSSVCLF